jgi:aspartate carbamoyltransferase catalytic subunit
MHKEHPLSGIAWADIQKLSPAEKGSFLASKDGRLFHVLVAQQFSREQLDALGQLATQIRFIAKNEGGLKFLQDLLAHKRAMLYFTQPSTRTFLSFCAACQILGVKVGEVRDTATSSEFKGESQEDSVRTFSSYFDFIIMRTEVGGLAERMAWVLSNSDRPIPIVNAGSGKDQHPTQALLDIYTLQRSFEQNGGIDGKTIIFVGDLLRGRTVRSLSSLLTNYRNVRQIFVAPEKLQISPDILEMLKAAGVKYELSDDFRKMIPVADAIYMTRVQDEWDKEKGESSRIDISKYCFTTEHLSLLKEDAAIMHPFPRRSEISPEVDHDPRAVYWRQMRNGMWVRAALIASIFRRDAEIQEYYEESL